MLYHFWRAVGIVIIAALSATTDAWADAAFSPLQGEVLVQPGKYQAVALGDASGQTMIYLPRQDKAGLMFLWQGMGLGAAPMVLARLVTGEGAESAAAWADYNGDGHLDLYVSRFERADLLYVNNGDNTFVEQAEVLGVGDAGRGQGAAWADYDGDGRLDLFVAHMGQANRLYRNAGRAFEAVRVNGGAVALSIAGAWCDYDKDGDLDLYVVNHRQPNELLENRDGALVANSSPGDLGNAGPGISASWVDFDSDGDWDISLSQYSEANLLLRNDGSGGAPSFRDVARDVGLADKGRGQQMAWGDYDLDGDLDVYVVNGGNEAADLSRMYRNDDGRFRSVARELGLEGSGSARALRGKGAVWWDMDADGDLDLYVVNSGEGTALYRNDVVRGGNHWLAVEMSGEDQANQFGIGGRIEIWSGTTVQQRQVGLDGSYLSQGSQRVHFGLGTGKPDSVVVVWPDGYRSKVTEPRPGIHRSTRRGPKLLLLGEGKVDLGTVLQGRNSRGIARVTNTGDADAQITSLVVEPAELATGPEPTIMVDPASSVLPVALGPGDTLAIVVGFSSKSERKVSGRLGLSCTGGEGLAIPFEGRASRLPTLSTEPADRITLARSDTRAYPSARVTLRNSGEGEIKLTGCSVRSSLEGYLRKEFRTEPSPLVGKTVYDRLTFTLRVDPGISTGAYLVVDYEPGSQQIVRRVSIGDGESRGYGSGRAGASFRDKAILSGLGVAVFGLVILIGGGW